MMPRSSSGPRTSIDGKLKTARIPIAKCWRGFGSYENPYDSKKKETGTITNVNQIAPEIAHFFRDVRVGKVSFNESRPSERLPMERHTPTRFADVNPE